MPETCIAGKGAYKYPHGSNTVIATLADRYHPYDLASAYLDMSNFSVSVLGVRHILVQTSVVITHIRTICTRQLYAVGLYALQE